MTIVYDDIQAVTRLLQEKEKVIDSIFRLVVIKCHRKLSPVTLGFRANSSYRQRASHTKWTA